MGYLFENAEKMDIQAERRKTAEALQRLEEAEHKATEAEQKATEAERKVTEAEQKVTEAEQKATEAERKLGHEKEQVIKGMIESLQECGIAKKQVIIKVAEKCGLTQNVAEEKVKLYWKA